MQSHPPAVSMHCSCRPVKSSVDMRVRLPRLRHEEDADIVINPCLQARIAPDPSCAKCRVLLLRTSWGELPCYFRGIYPFRFWLSAALQVRSHSVPLPYNCVEPARRASADPFGFARTPMKLSTTRQEGWVSTRPRTIRMLTRSFKDTAAFRKGAGEAIAISRSALFSNPMVSGACLFPGYLRRQAPIPLCFELSADDDEPPRATPLSLDTCMFCGLCCASRLLGASWRAPSDDWVVMHCHFGRASRSLLSYVTCFAVRPPLQLMSTARPQYMVSYDQ